MVQPRTSPMFRDQLAARFFTLGGVSVLLSLIVLVGFLLFELLPLFQKASLTFVGRVQLAKEGEVLLHVGADPGLDQVFTIDRRGLLQCHTFLGQDTGLSQLDLAARRTHVSAERVPLVYARQGLDDLVYLLWADGVLQIYRLGFEFSRPGQGPRRYTFVSQSILEVKAENNFQIVDRFAVAYVPRQKLTLVQLDDTGSVSVHHWWLRGTAPRSPFQVQGEMVREQEVVRQSCLALPDALGERPAAPALDPEGRRLYLGDGEGRLAVWDVAQEQAQLLATAGVAVSGGGVKELVLLPGGVSCVVVDGVGGISVWNYLTAGVSAGRLVSIQTMDRAARRSAMVVPIPAGKVFATYGAGEGLRLFSLISREPLLRWDDVPPLTEMYIGQGGASILGLTGDQRLHVWRLAHLQKAFQWRSLFAKIWYEGYPEPSWVWQSSSASSSFQPKLSLVPLIWGSVKGAVFGMLFSFPLAVLCAIYVSFLMHPKWRLWIKPGVELMSAMPTVVIGFFVAMWFSPIVHDDLLGLVGVMIMFPLLIGLALLVLLRSKRGVTGREFLWGMPIFFLALWGAFHLGSYLESHFFSPSFSLWLYERFSVRLEQRNSLVVAFGLGLAVIPLVFTVTEDALSGVPKSLVAAATALGSSRWQTLRYVVLPRAFPGMVVAGLMGFGRVLGETMIVLIASGNTPIISANPLNGMRSLAANMVVEISEASVDSRLYRVLILSAVLLLVVTFVVNTLAALLRMRIKRGHYEY
ncbi:ABC transporter permease subunit [Acanthopleuribacter pedis]|uniref:ABC transporter permease subunit n=1 Tax=Acanthopleuribacter pedis TaxID=442870 RepID=A0A8J7Q4X7_9BACT|nr:ABC transporter permease subunit [Acanthopleuribacter pedis]MBO1319125.1 ABC transporter permease subunit [Acanthopleuribacter pedis]